MCCSAKGTPLYDEPFRSIDKSKFYDDIKGNRVGPKKIKYIVFSFNLLVTYRTYRPLYRDHLYIKYHVILSSRICWSQRAPTQNSSFFPNEIQRKLCKKRKREREREFIIPLPHPLSALV